MVNYLSPCFLPFVFFLLTSLSLSSSEILSLSPSPSPSSSPSPSPSPSPLPEPPTLEESFELTQPLSTTTLPIPSPECTLSLLNYTFLGRPPATIVYSPPSDCPAPWSHAVLFLSGTVTGGQPDRIAAVHLAGAEILRTSTPKPFGNGTFWNVTKDITRYTSLLQQSNVSLSLSLENIGYDQFSGGLDVNLTVLFYKDDAIRVAGRKLGLGFGLGGLVGDGVYDEPADLIIPVSDQSDNWFRVEDGSNLGSNSISIPMNARKVVVELYVSSHGDDEFWYSNVPDSYILANNLTTTRGNGAFREVFVTIDGNVVASEIPFPVLYTGGIDSLLWEPVVGIGAFDLPSYDLDLTPFLGSLLDGKSHSFELGVTNAIKYWLVNANLHVWLDQGSSVVFASASNTKPTEFEQSFEYEYKQLDGKFEIEVERKSYSLGWVATSCGNFTTSIEKEVKFTNKMKLEKNGAYKVVKQKIKVKTKVRVLSETGSTISKSSSKRKYPLTLTISTLPGLDIDTSLIITNISHSLNEEVSNGQFSSSIDNLQNAGSSVVVKNCVFVSGVADTQQNLSYKSNSGYFTRSVTASGGKIVADVYTFTANSLLHKVLNLFFSSW